ncbi:hypothetical protein HC928_00225 [bacterium]|nr:hypothetical protein [bacterium]
MWRVLDLSGLTSSVRESRNYVRAGYVYLNGQPVYNLKDTVEVGSSFRLEIRFPNGYIEARNIFLSRPTRYRARINSPDTRFHKP